MATSNSWFYWALMSAVFAALTAVFAFTFLGKRPSLREWGGISMIATGVLQMMGFKNLPNLAGGYARWEAEGMPQVREAEY